MNAEVRARALDLVNRLRGRYAKGPIQADGEPEFGWRIFETLPDGSPFPRIHAEAADMIEELLKDVDLKELYSQGLQLGLTMARETAKPLLDHRLKLIETLKLISNNQEFKPPLGSYDPEPPDWARDSLNGDQAYQCSYCDSWLTVVRPGKAQCNTCLDGRDVSTLAAKALRV